MDIKNILDSSFSISKITIENFTVLDKTLNIEILVFSKEFNAVVFKFSEVKRLSIDSNYYSCSGFSNIVIEDLSSAQMEGIRFKVYISEDAMTFYCTSMTAEQSSEPSRT